MSLIFGLTQSGRFGTVLRQKNAYFLSFFCKKRAFFVIFCANLGIILHFLGEARAFSLFYSM